MTDLLSKYVYLFFYINVFTSKLKSLSTEGLCMKGQGKICSDL